MKLTDKHVSELTLNWLIVHFEAIQVDDPTLNRITSQETVAALLELKQRRAEDRAAYFKDQAENA